MKFPNPIQNLIWQFSKFPGIGAKTAEKFVFYLLRKSPNEFQEFIKITVELRNKIVVCEQCRNFTEKSPCEICSDANRNHGILCVVAAPQNMRAIEASGKFNGVYHILGGTIDQLNGITPDKLNIKQLVERLKKNNIKEVILAFNPDIQGESTNIYLKKILKPFSDLGIKITCLARGLPMGADLEYTDEITIANAIEGRRNL